MSCVFARGCQLLVVLLRSTMFGWCGVYDLVVGHALVSRALRCDRAGIRDWTLPTVSSVWSGGFLFDVVSGSGLQVIRRDVVFGCYCRCLGFFNIGHGSCMCSMVALLWDWSRKITGNCP